MSEGNTKKMDADATTPLPFEEFVRQQFALLLKQQAEMRQEIAEVRQESLERFLQLSRQIREVDTRLASLEQVYKDLDYKVDVFIREQLNIKRELHRMQETAIQTR
jgi:hypothetical protein